MQANVLHQQERQYYRSTRKQVRVAEEATCFRSVPRQIDQTDGRSASALLFRLFPRPDYVVQRCQLNDLHLVFRCLVFQQLLDFLFRTRLQWHCWPLFSVRLRELRQRSVRS